MHEYLNSRYISEFKNHFFKHLLNLGIDGKKTTSGNDIRSVFFSYFRSKEFKIIINKFCKELCVKYKIPINEFVVQPVPTPRIFRPGDHGTSWHTDFWYGHGETFRTVWVPIKGISPGATFQLVLSPDCNQKLVNYYSSNPELLAKEIDLLDCETMPALPPDESALIFDSNQLHSSLSNETNIERMSFDFRFGNVNDSTSNKDLSTYLKFENDTLTHRYKNKDYKFLKYIRGSKVLDTSAQHILIEGCGKNRQMNIIGQEAEIERYGQPMLLKHINDIKDKKSKFDGIIISTEKLIDENYKKKIQSSNVSIYFVLENKWMNE